MGFAFQHVRTNFKFICGVRESSISVAIENCFAHFIKTKVMNYQTPKVINHLWNLI